MRFLVLAFLFYRPSKLSNFGLRENQTSPLEDARRRSGLIADGWPRTS
jgi:hypothetical protein